MPRPPKTRHIQFQPSITAFKPLGVPMHELLTVSLSFDELEAIRLKDLEGLEQEDVARAMGISQSSVQRILTAARGKVADALVRGKALVIEGGEVELSSAPMRQFRCPHCRHVWEAPFGTGRCGREMHCPACHGAGVQRCDHDPWRQSDKADGDAE